MILFQDDDDANQTGGDKRPPVSYKIFNIILKYSVFPIFLIVLPLNAGMC